MLSESLLNLSIDQLIYYVYKKRRNPTSNRNLSKAGFISCQDRGNDLVLGGFWYQDENKGRGMEQTELAEFVEACYQGDMFHALMELADMYYLLKVGQVLNLNGLDSAEWKKLQDLVLGLKFDQDVTQLLEQLRCYTAFKNEWLGLLPTDRRNVIEPVIIHKIVTLLEYGSSKPEESERIQDVWERVKSDKRLMSQLTLLGIVNGNA